MLVLTDDISIAIADESNYTLRVSTPIERDTQTTTHLPFMGVKGADFVRETVDRYSSEYVLAFICFIMLIMSYYP